MKILTVDVGTGTQDIFLYDSRVDLENGFKLVLPSPTMIIHRTLKEAARRKEAVVLTGVTMGGGPSAWGAEALIKSGAPVFATPDAARSFDDDLEKVRQMGIQIVSEDEAAALARNIRSVALRDFDFALIAGTLRQYGVSLSSLAAVGVAVFDHGAAPADISDRQFRFDYLDQIIRAENDLTGFAHLAGNIPPIMTRLLAVERSADSLPAPLVVMDTAPAAVIGACYDPLAASKSRKLVANVGNFHTLAFRLGPRGIEGVFEHHTGLLDRNALEALLTALADGSLTHADVFDHHGHGALVYEHTPIPLNAPDFNVVVTGPRRSLLRGSSLKPYFAVPFGDMMIAGCFGLLAGIARRLPELAGPITASLQGAGGSGTPPWEIEDI